MVSEELRVRNLIKINHKGYTGTMHGHGHVLYHFCEELK